MHIPLVYQLWELFELDPEYPEMLHHGFFLTRAAVEWRLKELIMNNKHPYISYHVSELDFEDSFQQDMTNITVH